MRRLSFIVILLLLSCIKKREPVGYENLPPESFIFIGGEVDTVTARQEICWYGNDPDGEVVGFEWAIDDSSIKHYTEVHCSTFVFSSSAEPIVHTFYLWAIDNEGLRDPTPAILKIPVVNSPPRVYLDTYKAPPDTTFPVATFYWFAEDEDGLETITGFRYMLDYWSEWVYLPPETTHVTIRDIEPGERTLFIQAMDEAGALSDTATWTWYVIPAKGEVLVVEDIGGEETSQLYQQVLGDWGVEYSLWNIKGGLPPSASDIYAVINELGFNVILWASGDTAQVDGAGGALTDYLEAGKRMLISSAGVLNVELSPIMKNYFHVDTVTHYDKFLVNGMILQGQVEGYPDSLKVSASLVRRVDGFEPDSLAETLYRGPSAILEGSSLALRYPKGGPAQVVLFTFPLSDVNGLGNIEDLLIYVLSNEFGLF